MQGRMEMTPSPMARHGPGNVSVVGEDGPPITATNVMPRAADSGGPPGPPGLAMPSHSYPLPI